MRQVIIVKDHIEIRWYFTTKGVPILCLTLYGTGNAQNTSVVTR